MHELTKGSKTTLSTTAHLVEIASAWPGDVDLIAVLLTAADKVRTAVRRGRTSGDDAGNPPRAVTASRLHGTARRDQSVRR